MTVYFITPVSDPGIVKIGHTVDLPTRLQQIAVHYDDGIELLATCDGGQQVEAAFHEMFAPQRTEGEWFRRTVMMNSVINSFAENVTGQRRFTPRAKPKLRMGDSGPEIDARIARKLLVEILSKERAGTSLAAGQEKTFVDLHAINPLWTRRRVRSIWENAARHIEFWEIRDLCALSRVDLSQWSELLAEPEAA